MLDTRGQADAAGVPLLQRFRPTDIRSLAGRGKVLLTFGVNAPPVGDVIRYPGAHWSDCSGTVVVTAPRNLLRFWGLSVGFTAVSCVGELHTYQERGVNFLVARQDGYLAFDMGLGKTRTLAHAAELVAPAGPYLIVAPRFLRTSWQQELIRIGMLTGAGDPRWVALTGRCDLLRASEKSLAQLRDQRWVFCHPEILGSWEFVLANHGFQVAILDEAHLLRNGRTDRAKGARIATHAISRVWASSGTPMLNRVSDLWSVLSLTAPGAWGTRFDFCSRYAGLERGEYGFKEGDPTHTEELSARLESVMLRRTVADVASELPDQPPISWQPCPAACSVALQRASDALVRGAHVSHLIDMLLSGEGLGTETLRYLHELRSGLSTGKIPTTVQLVHSAVEQGANVVVFCHYRDSVEAIHAALADGALAAVGVHGGYTQDVRDARVEWFRSGFGNVLVATYDSLGVGVNLQCASVVVHHDLDWVPATHLQAAARVWRQGQTRPVISYLVYAENTVDEVIARVLASKIEDIAVVEGSAENYRGLGSLVIRHEVEEWFDRVLERVMA